MSDFSAQKVDQKKDWSLTAHGFHRLLSWLDEGANSDGQKYLEMRRRLVAYFDRKNCSAPNELADETLNRVARRLEEENVTDSEPPAARYCYIKLGNILHTATPWLLPVRTGSGCDRVG